MRPIPTLAVDFIAKWEGLRLNAYLDSAGIATIGYGHIAGVKLGDKITAEQAKSLLRQDLADAARKLEARIGPVVRELTEQQYAALLSFVFNLGANPDWTIWKLLKARRFDQIHAQFGKFVNARDPKTGKLVKVQGLVNRRSAEAALWATNEPGTETVKFTSGALRTMDTPPTPSDPVPAKKSFTVWGAITGAVALVINTAKDFLIQAPDFVRTALSAVNPFADKSPIAEAIANGLGALGAVAAIYVTWSVLKGKKESQS